MTNKPREKVEIVDVGPRDGLQNDPAMMDTETKLEFIGRLIDAGLRRMEVASFVNPKLVPQMADSADVMARVPRDRGVTYIGLALNEKGVDRAIEARCDEINYGLSASDTFGLRNQNATTAQALEMLGRIIDHAGRADIPCSATVSAAFGCPFEGEISVDRLVRTVEKVKELGASEIVIGDTIGVATPWDVKERLVAVRAVSGHVPLRVHFHNTRNTGIASTCAAVEAGIRIVDASAGGIGGCPFAPKATGNIATEDIVYALNRAGFDTGIDLDRLIATSLWLETALHHAIPSMVSKAGTFPKAATA